MKAIIMAGGEGTRLRPLTCVRPKPMVPLANSPVMLHTINLLKKYGFPDIGVTVQYMASNIMDYFGDGTEYGVNLRYFVENKPLGTAGSVKNAQEFLDETFIVISGDALTDLNLAEAVEFHKKNRALATLVLITVDNPLEYGIVITQKNGKIERFLEKPGWSEVFSDKVNTGIYILEPQVLDFIPEYTFFDFSKNLFPLLMEKGQPLYGYTANCYWCDIGNPEAYLQAHADILDKKVDVLLPYRQISPGIWVGNHTEIHPSARLEAPLIIGNNCRVGPEVFLGAYSVLADNCKLKERASVKKSVLGKGVMVGKGAAIRKTILCSGVYVKDNSATYEGAIVGDGSTIGENCTVMPQTKIWPGKTIQEGTTLKENLIWANRFFANLFGAKGIKGELNVDITPKLANSLGSAFGSLVTPGGKVGVSSDEYPASRMIKQALACGLQAVGQQVYDLGDLVLPMTRFALKNGRFSGGSHVVFSPQENMIQILFLNEKGANISLSQERKLENMLAVEDFTLVSGEKIKNILTLSTVEELYFWHLRQQIMDKLSLKVLFDCPADRLKQAVAQFLRESGCEVEEVPYRKLHEAVPAKGADIGIYLDRQGEGYVLFDEKGNKLEEDRANTLLAYLFFYNNPGSTLVVPVSAPTAFEKIAEKYYGRVVRTKRAVQARMETILQGGESGEKQFNLEFDGLRAILELLVAMSRERLALSEIMAKIPPFYLHRDAMECNWTIKGKIIRSLIENFDTELRTDTVEGVKFNHPEGWTLILPDPERPLVQIFSEGSSMEIANELTSAYMNKIKEIMEMA
ncbi:NTP transferase domain-containing protein [Thermanaerosceptrum fracticalcis]|uniref:NTP transferase domain-containing protein n=1 Tax=Thermanaerosceptrum fracticalcis TaxID=1712410 RepID=A0A7G6DYV2_THEFR|nr:sugar phosphate nucleotidyltransferase [Thermanaerosceptrum fracticalcis]QNB45006.1 NTP transferase domain-containing protein [Thermanaerosceptrum fracticalcis]